MTVTKRIPTGIPELDAVLRGGLLDGRIHLIEGRPGTGKTTIGMRFLIAAAAEGQGSLYVTLSETEEELHATAASHGWSLDGIRLFAPDLLEAQEFHEQTIMLPSDAELSQLVDAIAGEVERSGATRVVIDSMAEIRLLAHDSAHYRRQIITLRNRLARANATVILLDDLTAMNHAFELQSAVHGAITLEQRDRPYGAGYRTLKIVKLRGADYQSGWHDFAIERDEVLIFPSLIAEEHRRDYQPGELLSGVAGLDDIVGGGIIDGTSTMIVGPAGVGKTTLALQYALAAVRVGDKAAYFVLDEAEMTLRSRMIARFGIHDETGEPRGLLITRINPSRISAGAFIWRVRRSVEDDGVRIVVIDSINSYLDLVREESTLLLQMNELFSYLANMGVIAVIVGAHSAALDTTREPDALSIITDNVIALRFHEAHGIMDKAISVMKKRHGRHSHEVREFRLVEDGIEVGNRVDDAGPDNATRLAH
ncbi:ATPase domain-containing protein [Pseudoduganella lutea]|uniref:non-specific serine/threonine protein kinase n=1 Tax=Pseudoduganella lutea TaxID=321985 RepID=A0A4P6KVJ3_9BURK|nr:ATPase domain-containing protein [Pseudoduganella lutea]QBE62168.1 circadian clock protein KaiC [Pseudoduganella lutea]